MTKQFVYTNAHLDFLRSGYKTMVLKKLTAAFNKHFALDKKTHSIKSTLANHNITSGRYKRSNVPARAFTEAQKQWCIENYPLLSRKALFIAFNRAFNETRSDSTILSFLKRSKISSGRNGHFKQGVSSWNTGTKGVSKANSGSFAPGHVPPNWVPVGTERIVEGGYIEVKIAEPSKWKQKHRIIYESVHGPIPDNHKVRFKNGIPSDLEPDNLFLVNHSEHKYLNILDFNHCPVEIKDTLILMARVQSKTNLLLKDA